MRKHAAAMYRCIYSKTKNVYTISRLDDDRNILCENLVGTAAVIIYGIAIY